MNSERLISRVRETFPEVNAKFGAPPKPVVVFPAVHPAVGDIEIYDDGSELRVIAGHFTHGHFSDHHAPSAAQAERNIVDAVIDFLKRLLADQIVLWGSHRGGGGWCDRERASQHRSVVDHTRDGKRLYVWSGPLRPGPHAD